MGGSNPIPLKGRGMSAHVCAGSTCFGKMKHMKCFQSLCLRLFWNSLIQKWAKQLSRASIKNRVNTWSFVNWKSMWVVVEPFPGATEHRNWPWVSWKILQIQDHFSGGVTGGKFKFTTKWSFLQNWRWDFVFYKATSAFFINSKM